MLRLLLEFKELIFVVLIGLAIAGAAGHVIYTYKKVGQLEGALAQEQAGRKADREFYDAQVLRWEKQVAEQQAKLDAAKKDQKKIIEKNKRSFDELFKKHTKLEARIQNEITAKLRPTDVIVAPRAVEWLFNDAAKGGSYSPPASVRDGADSERTAYQVGTYDATAWTQALVDNALKYNELALRCDTLVDVVIELEAKYGNPTGGAAGATGTAGGNGSNGVVADQLF